MNEKNSIKDLIMQAKNTRYLVYEIAAAYLGVPPEDVLIKAKEPKEPEELKSST